MGLPVAEAILLDALIIQSHEMAQMAPSVLFVIASFGGLFACVVLCLICSECYSRYRNRQNYDGVNQSSSGEHELPVTQPIQIRRNSPTAPRPINSPPPSYNQVQREISHSRLTRQSNVAYDQVVSELQRQLLTQTPQSRSHRTHRSASRPINVRSQSLQQVFETGRRATPYPRQALQVVNRVPRIRIVNTPPLLFDQIARESVQYGLPEPNPNSRTMPQIGEAVREAIGAEVSEPTPTLRNPTGVGPTPTSAFDRVVPRTNPTAIPHTHQSALRKFQAVGSISSTEEAAIFELSRIELSPPPNYADLFPSPTPTRMVPDRLESPPIQYSPTWLRYRPPFLRVISPPSSPSPPHVSEEQQQLQFHVSMSSKSEDADGRTGIEGSTEAEDAVGGMPKAEDAVGGMPKAEDAVGGMPKSKGDISKAEKEGSVFKTRGAADKLKSERPTTKIQLVLPKAKAATSRTATEYILPKTTGRPPRTDTERVQPKSKTETPATDMQPVMPKAQGATSRTKTKRALPKTKGRPPRTDTEGVPPKSRDAAVMTETEWAMFSTEGATAMVETEWDMPKPDGARVSTEIESHMPETNITRTRSNRDLAMAEGATASVSIGPLFSELKDFRSVDQTESSDSTGNIETVDAKVEFGGARPKVRSKSAKKKKAKGKSKSKK